MKRSRGYFCKQSNVLDEAKRRSWLIFMEYLYNYREWTPKPRNRLVAKLQKRDGWSI